MTMKVERTRVVRMMEGAAQWEVATRAPAPHLRPFIQDLYGYSERTAALVRRREFPGVFVVVIFEFGPPVRIFDQDDVRAASRFPAGFVAGLDDRFTITEHDGFQHGLQLNLTPIGGRMMFGLPMSELAGRVVHARDLLPREHRSLTERLEALASWDARFDLLETIVCDRVQRAREQNPAVTWAFAQIARRRGSLEIGRLARDLGYSQTHLITLFRDQIGLPPKRVARLMRFDRLMRHLKAGGSGTWAELALQFGYYDQAHLVRDVRRYTGTTPTDARTMLIDLSASGDGDGVSS
jgi:AraC-like DNA-binding protein